MDRYQRKRLFLAAIIAALIGAGVCSVALLSGVDIGSLAQWWPSAIGLLALVFLCVEVSGRMRDPKEAYDRQLEDEWDR